MEHGYRGNYSSMNKTPIVISFILELDFENLPAAGLKIIPQPFHNQGQFFPRIL